MNFPEGAAAAVEWSAKSPKQLPSWLGRRLRLNFETPVVMAVINVTPDSFSDGGHHDDVQAILNRARVQVDAGASILDVGGESSRPGAQPVSAEIELERVVPVIQALHRAELPALISVDTRKARVAEAALAAGAEIINDISALGDPEMASVVSRNDAYLCLMHMRGKPQTMQRDPIVYDDVVEEVYSFLRSRLGIARAAGISTERMMIDPGIGFGKTVEHNLLLSRGLARLTGLGVPVLYGPSRKRFLGELTGRDVHDRERATAAACALGVFFGADALRVHDVGAHIDAIRLATAMRSVGS